MTLAFGFGTMTYAEDPRAMPPKEIRFSVRAESGTGTLNKGITLWGHGWIESTGNHATREESSRLFGAAPIHAYGWTECGFQFESDYTGWATLSIEAPPVEEEYGVTFTGAAAVTDFTVTGSSVVNPRLSRQTGNVPVGWTWGDPPGVLSEARFPGGDRRPHARIPAAGTLDQRIPLTAGQPVTVRFHARAVPPNRYEEMKRLSPSGTPAHKNLHHYRRGVSLGNYLEAPPDEDWGAEYGSADFDAIQSEGFDHVRIPVAWHHYVNPDADDQVDENLFASVDQLVQWAMERELAVLINWHHYDEFMRNPQAHAARFARVWRQIVDRYAALPGRIAFELLNEPHGNADTFTLNRIYQTLIPELRERTPDRPFFVGPGRYNHAAELPWLRLPDDPNIVVTIHHYEPFLFTHQGAAWTRPLTETTGIVFPGPGAEPIHPAANATAEHPWVARWVDAYNRLPEATNPSSPAAARKQLQWTRAWSDYYGRPVHVGEWGCVEWADADSRIRYHRTLRRLLDEYGLAWTLWDWKKNFRYWDEQQQRPVPGMRPALLP